MIPMIRLDVASSTTQSLWMPSFANTRRTCTKQGQRERSHGPHGISVTQWPGPKPCTTSPPPQLDSEALAWSIFRCAGTATQWHPPSPQGTPQIDSTTRVRTVDRWGRRDNTRKAQVKDITVRLGDGGKGTTRGWVGNLEGSMCVIGGGWGRGGGGGTPTHQQTHLPRTGSPPPC